jgi:hypothetical protein
LRDGRQRGSARGQMQKISAGKFHFEPPSQFTSLDHLVGAQQVHRRGTGHSLGFEEMSPTAFSVLALEAEL